MRPFPAVKILFAGLASAALILAASSATAQQQQQQQYGGLSPQQKVEIDKAMQAAEAQMKALTTKAGAEAADPSMAAGMMAPEKKSLFGETAQETLTEEEMKERLADKNSPQYKANKLAKQAQKDISLFGAVSDEDAPETLDMSSPPPPEMETLQQVHAFHASDKDLTDDVVTEDMAIDMRRDAQREAALSYGARGGLAKRNFQILEQLQGYETTLDTVFNFRQLLVKAPSGLMIEPPIVRENVDATVITEGGIEAAVADQVLKINKAAKIVTAPRDWRQYIIMNYETEIAPPPRILWPKNPAEQLEWNNWVKKGWEEGYRQGDEIFESNLNRLVADYGGMVRYRTLLAEGKISQPFALQEDRGVTGGKDEMRVGDRALRITGPSEFLTGAEAWKPADR